MGPNAAVRPSFKPYAVPRVDCCTITIHNAYVMHDVNIFMCISPLYTGGIQGKQP